MSTAVDWTQASQRLRAVEPALYEMEPAGALALDLNEDWLLELTPDGRLICQTGMAMEDIQSILSDGTPEDLGTDELAKQAKYYLQPKAAKMRPRLAGAGFTETTEMTDEHVAVLFERTIDLANLDELKRTIAWCRGLFR